MILADIDNIRSFVYFGAQNYISLKIMRMLVPGCFAFLTFITFAAAIAGNILFFPVLQLFIVTIYAIIVYTFHISCPKPSFVMRFFTNALTILSLNAALQLFAYTVLLAGKYISVSDIFINIALQAAAAVLYMLITFCKIKWGHYKNKKTAAYLRNTAIVSAGAFLGYYLAKMCLSYISPSIAAVIVMALFTALSVVFSVITCFNLIKIFFCIKYSITEDGTGNTVSLGLIFEQPKRSILHKIWSSVWKIALLVLLSAILYGIYKVSR